MVYLKYLILMLWIHLAFLKELVYFWKYRLKKHRLLSFLFFGAKLIIHHCVFAGPSSGYL